MRLRQAGTPSRAEWMRATWHKLPGSMQILYLYVGPGNFNVVIIVVHYSVTATYYNVSNGIMLSAMNWINAVHKQHYTWMARWRVDGEGSIESWSDNVGGLHISIDAIKAVLNVTNTQCQRIGWSCAICLIHSLHPSILSWKFYRSKSGITISKHCSNFEWDWIDKTYLCRRFRY